MKLSDEIKKQIEDFSHDVKVKSVGTVVELKDGVAIIEGLDDVSLGELVMFEKSKKRGLVLDLEELQIGVVVLDDYSKIKEGETVVSLGKSLSIGVNEKILGRVVDPLGKLIDGKEEISGEKKEMPLEKLAPGVIDRKDVHRPIQTGIKSIDSMIPIGRGQRELIIGDRQIGKTSIAIDTIINQKGKNCYCIYVSIGQKKSKLARLIALLESYGAMEYTVIVNADASDPAALQYIAPYAGCAIGEYFMENGKDALVVYDDLTKHAWAYREISLLLKRPPGREAYPGDIFYLHSRLLERAAQLSDEKGAGSLTALPIVETQAGDISAYIPTNIISITDGQIYLEPDLFYAGVRPALNVGLSVSRVGGSAQLKAMKKNAGQMRLDLAQYRELAAFAQFGTELDQETKSKLDRGERIMELILKQPLYNPITVEEQILLIYAVNKGALDKVEVNQVKNWEKQFRDYITSVGADVLKVLREKNEWDEKIENKVKELVERFEYK